MNNINTYIQLISTSGDTGVNGIIYLDQNVDVPVTYSLANIQDISQKNTTFSKPIQIPASHATNILFGNIFKLDTTDWTYDVNVKQKILLYQNGQIILRGYMKFVGFTKTSPTLIQGEQRIYYNVILFDDRSNFYDELGDSLLEDLDFSQYNHTYNNFYTQETTGNTWEQAYVYPMMYNPSSVNYKTKDFQPSIFVKSYLNNMFQTFGYSYESPSIDSEQFEAQIIPFNGEPKLSEEARAQRMFQASVSSSTIYEASRAANSNNYSADTLTTMDWYYPFNFPTSPSFTTFGRTVPYNDDTNNGNYDSGSTYNVSTYRFTSPANGTYDFPVALVGLFTWEPVQDGWLYPDSADPAMSAGTSLPLKIVLLKNGASTTTYSLLGSNVIDTVVYEDLKIPQRANITTSGPDVQGGSTYLKNFFFSTNFENVYLAAGETVEVRVYADTNRFLDATTYWDTSGHVGQASNDDNIDIKLSFTFAANVGAVNRFKNVPHLNNIDNGDTIILNDFIPKNIKIKDFLSSLIKLNNWYITTDNDNEKKLHIKTRDQFYDNNNYVDWSNKWQRIDESEYKLLSDLNQRRLIFKYKDDSDVFNQNYTKSTGISYGSKYIEFENQFLQGDKVVEPIFSPTPVVLNGFGLEVPAIDSKEPKNNLRILYYNGMQEGSWNYQGDFLVTESKTYYPQASHFYLSGGTIEYDLNWSENDYYYIPLDTTYTNNLYRQNWETTVNLLANGKMLTAWFDLNEYDIATLDFSRKIWLAQENSFFILNQIIDYNANSHELTKVELIKVEDSLQNRPRRRSAETVYKPQGELINEFYNGDGGTSTSQGGSSTILQDAKGDNTINSDGGGAVLGTGNEISAKSRDFIVSGDDNEVVSATKTTILGGTGNEVKLNAYGSTIIGGNNNQVFGLNSGATIIGGDNNYIDGELTGRTVVIGTSDLVITSQTQADAVYIGGITIKDGVISNATATGITISDYMPLSGGTFTGGISGTSMNFSGPILSAGTDLYSIFSSYSLWSASTGSHSIIANNGTGNLGQGTYNFIVGNKNSGITQNNITIANGMQSQASGKYAFIGNGLTNSALTSSNATVINGSSNIANGDKSLIINGDTNKATTNCSTVVNGAGHTASGVFSFIGNGGHSAGVTSGHTASGGRSFIGNGVYNFANAESSTVINGTGNTATSICSAILNGSGNTASGNHSFIGNGRGNTASNQSAVVLAGTGNTASGIASSVLAGTGNIVSGNYSAVIGQNLTGTSNNTLYTQNIIASGTTVIGSTFGVLGTSTFHDDLDFNGQNLVYYNNNTLLSEQYIYTGQTTNANETVLASFTMNDGSANAYDISILGNSGLYVYSLKTQATYSGETSSLPILIGSEVVNENSSNSLMTAGFSATTFLSAGVLRVYVKGLASTNVNWIIRANLEKIV